jgi:hypothetical protein
MRFITPKIHGVIDYLLAIFLAVSPTLFALEPKAANFTYALAIAYVLLPLGTNYKLGIGKFIPFGTHGMIELVLGCALILFGFSYFHTDEMAKTFYAWFGSVMLVIWLLTEYDKPKEPPKTSKR